MGSERLGQSSPSRDGLSGSNDDSAVVSLKALVAKADAKATATRAASTEDSGLIDLKKLMASAPLPSSDSLPPVLQPPTSGLFDVPVVPLNSAAAQVSGSASETAAPASSAPAKWFAAAAALAFVVVGTIGVLHARTDRENADQASVAAANPVAPNEAAQPEPAVAPAAIKEPEVAKEAAPEVTQPAATQARTSRQATANSTSRDNTRRETTTVKSTPATVTAPAAACDLMCEMRRAAEKKKAK